MELGHSWSDWDLGSFAAVVVVVDQPEKSCIAEDRQGDHSALQDTNSTRRT